MPLSKIKLTPGINREGTSYSNENGYYACDKVRFSQGYVQSIGGWTPYASDILGLVSSLMTYSCSCGTVLTTLGTHLKFYVEKGSGLYDITPVRATVNVASNAFTTDTAEPTVLVCNVTGHDMGMHDYVTISGVVGDVNGVPAAEINGEHRTTFLSLNTFSIEITTAPTSSGTTGAADFAFQVQTGSPVEVVPGWGAGTWGSGVWGDGTSAAGFTNMRLWSVDNYGNSIVYGPRGGGLYYWGYSGDASLAVRGEAIKDMVGANSVPLYQNQVLVSDQRFVITIGSNDYLGTDPIPMLVRWSDQENYLQWEPMATTQAGSQILAHGSELVCAHKARQEILIWSDSTLYSMQFLGPPFIYGFSVLGDGVSIISPKAAIVVNSTAYWMGEDKFYVYNGAVQTLPCTVRSYIFGDMNSYASMSVTTGSNEAFNEVWWFYPSKGSYYNDKYVVFNYVENVWFYGTLRRSAWLDSRLRPQPIAAGYDPDTEIGTLYYHEAGCDDGETNPPSPIQSFVESADFDIDDGHNFGFVTRIIPDMTFEGSDAANPAVTLTVKPKRFSGSNYGPADAPTVTRTAAAPIEQYTEQVFVRVRGRQMAFRVDSNQLGTKWRMGAMRIDIKSDGRK